MYSMFIAALLKIAKIWKQCTCPLINENEWMKKCGKYMQWNVVVV